MGVKINDPVVRKNMKEKYETKQKIKNCQKNERKIKR
jgi:hypothetical protein